MALDAKRLTVKYVLGVSLKSITNGERYRIFGDLRKVKRWPSLPFRAFEQLIALNGNPDVLIHGRAVIGPLRKGGYVVLDRTKDRFDISRRGREMLKAVEDEVIERRSNKTIGQPPGQLSLFS